MIASRDHADVRATPRGPPPSPATTRGRQRRPATSARRESRRPTKHRDELATDLKSGEGKQSPSARRHHGGEPPRRLGRQRKRDAGVVDSHARPPRSRSVRRGEARPTGEAMMMPDAMLRGHRAATGPRRTRRSGARRARRIRDMGDGRRRVTSSTPPHRPLTYDRRHRGGDERPARRRSLRASASRRPPDVRSTSRSSWPAGRTSSPRSSTAGASRAGSTAGSATHGACCATRPASPTPWSA